MEKINVSQAQPVIRDFETKATTSSPSQIKTSTFFIFVAVAVFVGVLVGFLPSKLTKSSNNMPSSITTGGKTVGVVDKKTFKDSASGTLRAGGIDGEGSFHLERPGGDSQNVYLTSTTVDLSPFVGKKVTVWGQTYTGNTAGWLMDVGLVEIAK